MSVSISERSMQGCWKSMYCSIYDCLVSHRKPNRMLIFEAGHYTIHVCL